MTGYKHYFIKKAFFPEGYGPNANPNWVESPDILKHTGYGGVDKRSMIELEEGQGKNNEFLADFVNHKLEVSDLDFWFYRAPISDKFGLWVTSYKPSATITTPTQRLDFLVKIPNPDLDYKIEVGKIELPYRTTGKNDLIVTLKLNTYLKYVAKTGKLSVGIESMVVKPHIGPSRLKERPDIMPPEEHIIMHVPDEAIYEATTNRVFDIPVIVEIKEYRTEIKGK